MRIEWDKYGNCLTLIASSDSDNLMVNGWYGSKGNDVDFFCRIDLPEEKLKGLIDRLIAAQNEFYTKESYENGDKLDNSTTKND